MTQSTQKDEVADDARDTVEVLLRMRIPWLIIGLIGGVFVSFIVSRFESVLSKNIALAYFLPFIVYMSDAVGTPTETIYIRNLIKSQISFKMYFIKETIQGILFGALFGSLIGTISFVWLQNLNTSITVGIAMFLTMSAAPAIALIVAEVLFKKHRDPALGAGPFTTLLQNVVSVVIYFIVASFILFK